MGGGRRVRGLLIGTIGSLYMGWFIYALLASVSCHGPACPGVSALSALGLPVGLLMVLVGVFIGGGFLIVPVLFLGMGIAALAVGAFVGMPDIPGFPWWFGGLFVAGGLALFAFGPLARRMSAAREKIAAELLRNGVKGVGTIVVVEDTGITFNENPRVIIRMRIEPDDGSPAVERSKAMTVSRVAVPRAGESYTAWFDRTDKGKWLYGPELAAYAPTGGKPRGRHPAATRAPGDETAAGMVEALAELTALWKDGALTDAEFAAAKASLLPPVAGPAQAP
jgi:membrane protein implicated in regulation of membrane protease activity